MNIEKGIFRLMVLLSVLSGLTILIAMRENVSNNYYSEKEELIDIKEKKLLHERNLDLDIYYAINRLKEIREVKEKARQEIAFGDVIKHKPMIIFLPIFWFLVGFLPVWAMYFMVYYVIRGFRQ
jgi:hypothetical protein